VRALTAMLDRQSDRQAVLARFVPICPGRRGAGPAAGRHTILLIMTVALVAAAGLCAIGAARDLHALLELAYTRH
jgi:hypothetical protein